MMFTLLLLHTFTAIDYKINVLLGLNIVHGKVEKVVNVALNNLLS